MIYTQEQKDSIIYQSQVWLGELGETLTSKFGFDIDDINNSFRYDKDGNFLGANLSDSRMDKSSKSIYKLRQSIFRSIDKAREHSNNLWLNGKWDKAIFPLEWMINKFCPPDWEHIWDKENTII